MSRVETPEPDPKGFSRIHLQPGETRIVTFLVSAKAARRVEGGEQVGGGSKSLYRWRRRTFPSRSEHRVQSEAMTAFVRVAAVQAINGFRNEASGVR
jgi:hypothetical protein